MEIFQLRSACNELLASLKAATQNRNIIKLSIDVQVPDEFIGSPAFLLHSIREAVVYLSSLLINGIISIEISLRGVHGVLIALEARATALGSSRTKEPGGDRFNQVLQNPTTKINFSKNAREMTFEFSHALRVPSQKGLHLKRPFEDTIILVAEDNEINAMVFSSFLEEWGVETTIVSNGADAVDRAREKRFDAILMDIHMPELNGSEAIRRIRQFDAGIPVIALTASTREEDVRGAMASGANDFLLKPVSSGNLFQLLSKYL